MPSLHQLPALSAPTVVIDLETTGLDPEDGHRIIELAAIRVEPDGTEHVLNSLVQPGMAIPFAGQEVHGITDAMVQQAPPLEQLLPQLALLFDGAVVVAHNASFDLGFLEHECERLGCACPRPGAVVDTLQLARTVFGLVRCSLSALAERIGVPHPNAHRALPDARATLHVYRAMVRSVRPPEIPTVGELQRLTVSLASGGDGRKAIRRALREAWERGQNVVIDYTSGAGGALTTRREITITDLRPPYVEAQCHLREAPRVFKVSRIRRVETVSGEPIQDLPTTSLDDTDSVGGAWQEG